MSVETKKEIRRFEENWINGLERIAAKLRAERFEFDDEKGIALPKGKGKKGRRPLVIAPIENRIVRRAILDVLQGYGGAEGFGPRGWSGVDAIRDVLQTPTSVGGVPHRGVPHGLSLIDAAIRSGYCWFARSDIKDFFTRISVNEVVGFVSRAVDDARFVAFFHKALATNLVNQRELEERHLFKLFPDRELGVAQGSALSALAGNIALRDFDAAMNGRGIVCVRYIDDFMLLGKSEQSIRACYASARRMLSRLDMQVYDLEDGQARQSGKVGVGNIYDGTDFLGYRLSGLSRQPGVAACRALLLKLDQVVIEARREMLAAAEGRITTKMMRYHRAHVLLNEIVWGWAQAFNFTTATHVFESLDREIDKRLELLATSAREIGSHSSQNVRRRVMGVHLLADTRHRAFL